MFIVVLLLSYWFTALLLIFMKLYSFLLLMFYSFVFHLYGLCRFLLELDDVVFRISYIFWIVFLFCLEL